MLAIAAAINGTLATVAALLSATRGGVAGLVVAVVLLQPIALVLATAAIYVAAPFSRFGRWLDRNLVRLHEPPVASLAVVLFVLAALAIVLPLRLLLRS